MVFSDVLRHAAAVHRIRWRVPPVLEPTDTDSEKCALQRVIPGRHMVNGRASSINEEELQAQGMASFSSKNTGRPWRLDMATCSDDHSVRLYSVNGFACC